VTDDSHIDFGRGDAAVLRQACLEEIIRLRGDEPLCRTVVRFIYYRMVAQRLVPKDAECVPQPGKKSVKLSSDYVSQALTWLREHGFVDDAEIVDESRSTMNNVGFPNVRDGLIAYLNVIELDPWDGDPPVLVVESRSLRSFFGPLAEEFRIDVITLGGQSSRGYLANDAARHLGEDTLVLAVVDYDKAGGDIENSAHDRLRVLAPDWHGEWLRAAVTDDQFQEFGVNQGLMITKADNRFKPPRSFDTLEAEGVEQSVLEASVRDTLEELLPVSLEDVIAEEERQQDRARSRLQSWSADLQPRRIFRR
jgi:hypothetical protein